MKKLLLLVICFIVPVFSYSDALWNKAIKIKKANEKYRFHKSYTKLLSASKKNTNVAEMWKAHKYIGKKEYVKVLKVLKNGKERNLGAAGNRWGLVRNKKRKNINKKLNKKSFLVMFDKDQIKYKIRKTGKVKTINGIRCAEYKVIFKHQKMKSFAYLNLKNGAPVKILFIPSGYKSSIKNSKPSYGEFEEKDGKWYLKKAVVNLSLGYFGKTLNIQTTMEFSDYR